jgi:hypothetical protein
MFILNTGELTESLIATLSPVRVLVFRTNLKHQKDLLIIAPVLNALAAIQRWNVDQEDVDNVLRIETRSLDNGVVIDLLNKVGYFCEELPD